MGSSLIPTLPIGNLMKRSFDLDSNLSKPLSPPIYLCSLPVVGRPYHDPDNLGETLMEGDGTRLVREPENPHDRYAIAVYAESTKLGYLPRSHNLILARLMDAGKRLSAVVRAPKSNGELRVSIRLIEI